AGLADNGVAPGSRVAVVDGGSLLSIASVLGAARIGAAAALMNPALTTPELRSLMQNAGCADVAVAGDAHLARLHDADASKVLTAADLLDDSRGRRPGRASLVHQRHHRPAEGNRNHQRATGRTHSRNGAALPAGRSTR